jgi:hypothetical protein
MIKPLPFVLWASIICTLSLPSFAAVNPSSSANPRIDTIPPPSPESFVNEVFHSVVDSSFSSYYLVVNADTCRFMKYDYDEWINYHLQESVPITTLNELSEKVYLSHNYPYHWQQHRLHEAICITPAKADSIFTLANPTLNKTKTRPRKILKEWQQLPAQAKTVFSFSLPQFTDDGQYAVIDLNMICGSACGSGLTFIFHNTTAGWRRIGIYRNWGNQN